MKIDTNINKTATSSNFQSWVRYSLFHLQKKSVAKQNQYFLSVSAGIEHSSGNWLQISIGCRTLPLFFIGKNISKGKILAL